MIAYGYRRELEAPEEVQEKMAALEKAKEKLFEIRQERQRRSEGMSAKNTVGLVIIIARI